MKDDYYKKASLKATQRAKLLIARPDFQEEIISLRKKFKIPINGFEDQEVNQKWHDNFYQSDDEYFETVWLKRRSEIIKLRKEGKFREAEDLKRDLNDVSPINAYRIAIKNLLKKYKLPLRWEENIRRYILFNSIDHMWLPSGITIHSDLDKDTGLNRLSIGIEEDTIIDDIKQAWPIVEFRQRKLHSYTSDKFHPIPNLDRDKRAYELQERGKSLDEIGEILNVEFENGGLDNNQLNIIIKRYKKRLNIG